MSLDAQDLTPLATWRHLTASTTLGDSGCITTAEYCPARTFTALTLPFPLPSDPVGTFYVVRRLAFTITSHDQGFSGDLAHLKGTYEASHTFFDACIIQPSGQERVRRVIVQRNVHAKWDYTTHHVAWDHRLEQEKPRNATGREFSQTWEEWLRAIKSGDDVRLVPRANWPLWTNYVQGASIDIWVEVVIPEPSLGHSLPTRDFSKWNDYHIYRKLDTLNKEIRLVELEPSECDTDPISFVLRYTPLADKEGRLKFSALSYCWGSAEDPQTVMIRDGKDSMNILASVTMSVNRNLYSALKKLRRHQKSHLLWIDLLCIKQSDLAERAQQVELMGEIYSSAQTIYVWLGEGTQWAQEDCHKIRSVEHSYKQLLSPSCPHGSPRPNVGDTEPRLDDKIHYDMDNSEKPGTERHPFHPSNTHEELWTGEQIAMCHDQVFELPWFRRVWVLQEVWNRLFPASDDLDITRGGVSVLCGEHELTWSSIIHANHCLDVHFQYLQNTVMPRVWSSLFHVERPFYLEHAVAEDAQNESTSSELLKASFRTSERLPILQVVTEGLDMEATDPRDKIFALLTFGEETHNISQLHQHARPNYEKSTVEVFSDFTKWWISHHGRLDILSAVHAQPRRTWIDLSPHGAVAAGPREVDYAEKPSWSFWYEGRSEWSLGTLGLFNNRGFDFCASGATKADVGLDLESSSATTPPGMLALKGFRVDILKHKAHYPFPNPYSSTSTEFRPFANSRRMLAVYEAVFDPASVLNMWEMTKLNWKHPLAAKEKRDDAKYYTRCGSHLTSHGFYKGDSGDEESSSAWEVGDGDDDGAEANSSRSWCCFPCHGKCLFRTEGGKVGLCPAVAKRGDVIVILYGGNVPYLLSRRQLTKTRMRDGSIWWESVISMASCMGRRWNYFGTRLQVV